MRAVHVRWAVLTHIEVFVFRIGTVGQSTAHLVGPVPNNLWTAEEASNHGSENDLKTPVGASPA